MGRPNAIALAIVAAASNVAAGIAPAAADRGRIAAQEVDDDRFPDGAAAARTSSATDAAGGFEIRTISSVPGSAASRSSAGQHHRAADSLVQIAPADADRLRDAGAVAVDQAAHLLQAGPGRADQADRAAPDGVGEPERHAVEDRGPAVRAHHQQALCPGQRLQLDLVLDRDVVAEEEHVEAALERLERLRRRRTCRAWRSRRGWRRPRRRLRRASARPCGSSRSDLRRPAPPVAPRLAPGPASPRPRRPTRRRPPGRSARPPRRPPTGGRPPRAPPGWRAWPSPGRHARCPAATRARRRSASARRSRDSCSRRCGRGRLGIRRTPRERATPAATSRPIRTPSEAVRAGRRAPGDRPIDRRRDGPVVRSEERREQRVQALGKLAGCGMAQERGGDGRRPLLDVVQGQAPGTRPMGGPARGAPLRSRPGRRRRTA